MKEVTIDYEENNKQKIFHKSSEEEVLYGGAKGGGKSCALVMDALKYALIYKKSTIYLFRKTYDDLEANLISEWFNKVPSIIYKYNASKKTATLINGSKIFFRFVSNYKDAIRYDGRSIDYIGIDELTHFEEEWVQILLSCLRSPKGYPTFFRATANPGNIGHAWVKARYITSTDYGKKIYEDKKNGNKIKFIPARVYDNKVLTENDPKYIRRLENLPEAKRKAYLEGDWDIYEGRAFPEFNEEIHVIDDFKIPKHWVRWMAVDNGYADPFYFAWFTISEDGIVYLYREYTRKHTDIRIPYSEQGKNAMEMMSKPYVDENGEIKEETEDIEVCVAGLDAFNKHHRDLSGKTLIDYYIQGGFTVPFTKAITSRELRKSTLHEYLKPIEDENTNTEYAKFQVFKSCKTFIETFKNLMEEEGNPEVVADDKNDHAYDAVGYGLIYYHSDKSKKIVEEKRIETYKNEAIKRKKKTKKHL